MKATTGICLLAVGAALLFSRRRETRIALGVLGMILGVFTILLPTALIGVCMSADMLCNSLMKPALILVGSLAAAISLVFIVVAAVGRKPDQA